MALNFFQSYLATTNSIGVEYEYENNDRTFETKIYIYAYRGTVVGQNQVGTRYNSGSIPVGGYKFDFYLVEGLLPNTTYTFYLTLVRNSDDSILGTRTLQINTLSTPAPGPFSPTFPNWTTNLAGYDTTTYSSGATSVSRISGSIPPGLQEQAVSGGGYRIYGTPNTRGTYSFTLRASNSGPDTTSQSFSIIISDPAPAAPTITSTSRTSNSITFNWIGPSLYANKYEVRLGTSGNYTDIGTAKFSHTFLGLNSGQTYTVSVRARNLDGQAGAAASTTITTAAPVTWSTTISPITVKIGTPISGQSLANFVSNETSIIFASGEKPTWLAIDSNGVLSGTPAQRAERNTTAEANGLIDQYVFYVNAVGERSDGQIGNTLSPPITLNVTFPGRRFGAGGWTPIRIARRFDGEKWVGINNVARRTSSNTFIPPTAT